MTAIPDRRRILRGAGGGLLAGFAIGGLGVTSASAASSGVAGGSTTAATGTTTEGPRGRVSRVANAAMDRFDRGWQTGNWQPFLAMLTDDCSFWFPEDPARGRYDSASGRQALAEWTAFHAAAGNRVAGRRRRATVAGDRVFYEYDSVGASPGTAAYRNWELIVVEVRGDRISAFHEYWGDARPAAGGAPGAP